MVEVQYGQLNWIAIVEFVGGNRRMLNGLAIAIQDKG